MTIEGRQPVYADENIDARIVAGLRRRGFDIVTAGDVAMLGQTDEAQLAHAAAMRRVLLTFDRRDFRRLHARFLAAGHRHVGIALLPQSRVWERTVIRAAMLLDWLGALQSDSGRLASWNDLQIRLHRAERLAGYEEHEVRIALGDAIPGP